MKVDFDRFCRIKNMILVMTSPLNKIYGSATSRAPTFYGCIFFPLKFPSTRELTKIAPNPHIFGSWFICLMPLLSFMFLFYIHAIQPNFMDPNFIVDTSTK